MPWIFLLLPWLELWTLIELGSRTSALTALAYVFLTLVLGMALIRRQGLTLLKQLQQQGQGGILGPQLLMDELSMVSCGLLLLIPGLITDALALIFLVGPLRRRLLGSSRIRAYASVHQSGSTDNAGSPGENVTLEGEFRRLDD